MGTDHTDPQFGALIPTAPLDAPSYLDAAPGEQCPFSATRHEDCLVLLCGVADLSNGNGTIPADPNAPRRGHLMP